MLRNLTIVRTYAFTNLGVEISMHIEIFVPMKVSFFDREFSNPGLIIEMVIQKNLKVLEKIILDCIPCEGFSWQ